MTNKLTIKSAILEFDFLDFFKHMIIIFIICAFWITYYISVITDNVIYDWGLKNWIYITENIDVTLFFGFIVALFVAYVIYAIIKVVSFFWASYSNVKLKAYLVIFRYNFIVFAVSSVLIAGLFNLKYYVYAVPFFWKSFEYNIPIIVGIIALIVFNLFFRIDYSDLMMGKESEDREYNLLKIVSYLVLALGLLVYYVLYLSFPSIQETAQQKLAILFSDLSFEIMFWIVLCATVFWDILLFFTSSVGELVKRNKEKLVNILKIGVLIVIVYFIVKMGVFNLNSYLEEPYPTWISLGSTTLSTLFANNSKKILLWGKGVREKLSVVLEKRSK